MARVAPDWSEIEDRALLQMVGQGVTAIEIAAKLGRTLEATRTRARRLSVALPRRLTTTWPPTKEATLREMAADGASAQEIAAAIGKTRSAVIGKADRLGVDWPEPQSKAKPKPTNHEASSKPKPLPPAGADMARPTIRFRKPKKPLAVVATPPAAVAPPPAPPRGTVSIWNVGPFDCRFPVTEVSPINDFRFCGARAPFYGYCPKHSALMRQPCRQRRR